jgi:glycosyltransferase involved in cell wall biosynthesis
MMASSPSPIAPRVTVVVPAFNAAGFIEAALQSVRSQRYQDFEVIVVDDKSADDTVARVERIAGIDSRVSLMRHDTNSGRPAVARNTGIAAARGEFIAFLDADDVWLPWKLQDQVTILSRHGDLVLVYSMFQSIGRLRRSDIAYGVKPLPFRAAVSRADLERENVIPCSSVVVRKDAVDAAGGFDVDPQLAAVEDYDLWLRLSARGGIGLIPRIHGLYRADAEGISGRTDMPSRVRYLMRKRGIDAATYVQRSRGRAGRLFRGVVHDAVIAAARVVEGLTRRRMSAHIPLVRQGRDGRSSLSFGRAPRQSHRTE